MGFEIGTGNERTIDFSVPIPTGTYALSVEKAAYGSKKGKPDESQITVNFYVIALINEDGTVELDTPHKNRKPGWYYLATDDNPKSKPYQRTFLTAIGFDYKDDDNGNRNFVFEDHVEDWDGVAQEMVGRTVLCKLYERVDKQSGRRQNGFGVFEKVSEDMDELMY